MAEQTLETYHGNCHCGAFKFSVKLPKLKQVNACNCSICSKVIVNFRFFALHKEKHALTDKNPLQKGYLWAMPSSNDLFVVEKGDDALQDYQFGNKIMTHKVRMTLYPSWIRDAHLLLKRLTQRSSAQHVERQ